VSRTGYPDLFNALGTTWGSGDGSTTFNLPDMRGRTPVGVDTGGVHMPANEPALGATGGEETHVLTTTEMPSHNHGPATGTGFNCQVSSGGGAGYYTGSVIGNYATTGNTGGSAAHNNCQPWAAFQWIIKT
jgi:microcystin-dependent protein